VTVFIRRSKRRWTSVAAVVLAGVMFSACTFVPTDDQPQPVNSKTVPFNLLGKHQGSNQR
jgi:hypothetical protein